MPILMSCDVKPSGVLFIQPILHLVKQDGPDGETVGHRVYHTDHFTELDTYVDYVNNQGPDDQTMPRELIGAKALFDLDWVMEPDFEFHIVHDALLIDFTESHLWWVNTSRKS